MSSGVHGRSALSRRDGAAACGENAFFARFIEYVESSPCCFPACLHIRTRRAYGYHSAVFDNRARRNNFHGEHRRACAGECVGRTVCRFYRRIHVARHGIAGCRISCRDGFVIRAERFGATLLLPAGATVIHAERRRFRWTQVVRTYPSRSA